MRIQLRNKEANNAGWIIGEQVFQMMISLVIGILSARYLGPANYGLINYTASFVNFILPVATLGMDGVIIKKMIAKPEDEGVYLGGCILYRLISAFLCAVSVIVIVWVLNPNDMLMLSLIALQSIQLFFRAFHILDSWFQRYLKSKYVSIAKMAACVLVASYRIYLLVTEKDVRWFALSNSLTAVVIMVVLYVAYNKNRSQKITLNIAAGRDVLKDSYHFILSGLMAAIYSQMDKVMLGEMVSSEAVGLYVTAASLCTMWLFVPTAIIQSLRPGILELKQRRNEKRYLQRLQQLYAIIIYLCACVSVIIFLFGDFAVNLLYGDAYAGATGALKILIWSEVFSMIGTARGVWILAEHKNKYVKYYLGMGAVLNLILNSMLIPCFGIKGASFATLVTQIFTCLIAPLCFKETRMHTKIVLQAMVVPRVFRK